MYHYYHELFTTPNGTIIMLDVTNVEYGHGYESAYAIFDKDTFEQFWRETGDEDDAMEYDTSDIQDYGEESGAFDCWVIFRDGYRNPDNAVADLRRYVKKL